MYAEYTFVMPVTFGPRRLHANSEIIRHAHSYATRAVVMKTDGDPGNFSVASSS